MQIANWGRLAVAGIGLAMLAGGTPALAATTTSGNFNLKTEGYELLTPSGGSTERVDIEGLGQLVVTSTGSISGTETFTSVNAEAGTEDVCNGTIAGSISAPAGAFASGTGNFGASLAFTPTSGGTTCIPSTATLSCARALFHLANASNLCDGEYHCIVTGVTPGTGTTDTVNGASMRAQMTNTRGSNAPGN